VRNLLLIACVWLPLVAVAQQNYPNRPFRLIVPYPPGGANDIFARPIARKLSEQLGQQVVVDNRSGASGVIGAQLVAAAAPDGYTLLVYTGSMPLIPLTMKNAPFDVQKDFTCIVAAATSTTVVVVHPGVPAQSMKDVQDTGHRRGTQRVDYCGIYRHAGHYAGVFQRIAGAGLMDLSAAGEGDRIDA
jgi:tripartite-type tricarboxylate transporter receptor subunit TctC